MKKLSVILFVLMIFCVSNLTAEELSKAKNELILDASTEFEMVKVAAKVPLEIKKAIVDQLVYPKHAIQKSLEGQVYLRLCVCSQDCIKLLGLSATNPYLGEYVKKELSNLKVDSPSCKPGQVFLLKIDFDLIPHCGFNS